MKIINEQNIEKGRKPGELYDWCNTLINEIGNSKGGVNSLRMKEGLCKPMLEEVLPMAIWAKQFFKDDAVIIVPKLGSQNYDGTVTDGVNSKNILFYLEVTQAHMGRSEHLRMKHLTAKGWAPGPLTEMTDKDLRETSQGARAFDTLGNSFSKVKTLIKASLLKKLNKNYPENTMLLIAFEDFLVKDEAEVNEKLIDFVTSIIGDKEKKFIKIFLVGMSKKLLIDCYE